MAPFVSGISEQTTPISKAKQELSYEEVKTIKGRLSTPNWQSAGDDGVYINTHFPSFYPVDIAHPTLPNKDLKRNIQGQLKDMTFKMGDGSTSTTLQEHLDNDFYRVRAVMMAHKGKVVFEAFPGMNPNQSHVWFSTSKTTVGSTVLMLEEEGLLDLEKMVTEYAVELKGTAWDNIPLKHALNMAVALDLEETTEAFLDPNSWIEQFFASLFAKDAAHDWIQMLRDVKPLPGLEPGSKFQYSTAVTQVLMLCCEHATNKNWVDIFNEHFWSKLHVKGEYKVGLSSNGEPVPGGINYTTPEDMLKYAMSFLPESWQNVADERVVPASVLKKIQTFGDPKAYEGCTEQGYSTVWFGETAERNSCQWDAVFADGAMFKHGNMHQGIYVDPERDFCAMYFSTCPNDRPDYMPGFCRQAAKNLAGK